MGLIDKFKNLFSDEIEETPEPVKKEVIKVEIPSPAKEDHNEETITDNESLKKEDKFNFPVYFDDEDFDALDYKPKEKVKEKPKSSYMLKTPAKDDKKPFSPSPIISPIYGVLDKNYSKDDIRTKNHKSQEPSYRTKELTLDDIRKKAFGTLEQDLEEVILGNTTEILLNDYEDNTINIFDELEEVETTQLEENKNKQPFEEESNIVLENLDMTIEEADKEISDEDEIKKMFKEDENLTEGDLFNLIDSMYEKGDEENDM